MTPTETAAILRQFNEWRRDFDDRIEQPDSREIGEAIDAAVEMIDRLEEAESEAIEQARLNGMGSEREAALMAKLEAAEKERDAAELMSLALRAKIAEMEKQEPVGTLHDDGYFVWRKTAPYQSNYAGWKTALYALPGAQAQPAPSVPDVPAKSLKPVIDWLRNGCDPQEAAKELELLIGAALKPEAKPCP